MDSPPLPPPANPHASLARRIPKRTGAPTDQRLSEATPVDLALNLLQLATADQVAAFLARTTPDQVAGPTVLAYRQLLSTTSRYLAQKVPAHDPALRRRGQYLVRLPTQESLPRDASGPQTRSGAVDRKARRLVEVVAAAAAADRWCALEDLQSHYSSGTRWHHLIEWARQAQRGGLLELAEVDPRGDLAAYRLSGAARRRLEAGHVRDVKAEAPVGFPRHHLLTNAAALALAVEMNGHVASYTTDRDLRAAHARRIALGKARGTPTAQPEHLPDAVVRITTGSTQVEATVEVLSAEYSTLQIEAKLAVFGEEVFYFASTAATAEKARRVGIPEARLRVLGAWRRASSTGRSDDP